jgi:hypothetical protein
MKILNGQALLRSFFAFMLLAGTALSVSAAGKETLDKYWVESGKSYPAGKEFKKPTAWAPGQYVITGSKSKGKITSVTRMLLVRKENGGWVIETTDTDKKGAVTVSQMLLMGYDEAIKNGDTSKFSLGWMKNKDKDGVIQVIEGDQLAFFNVFAKSTYDKLLVNIETVKDGGTVTVPAGIFAATNSQRASVKIIGMTIETDSWFHSAVPVNGMVKSVTTDGKSETVLISFGFDGKSDFE